MVTNEAIGIVAEYLLSACYRCGLAVPSHEVPIDFQISGEDGNRLRDLCPCCAETMSPSRILASGSMITKDVAEWLCGVPSDGYGHAAFNPRHQRRVNTWEEAMRDRGRFARPNFREHNERYLSKLDAEKAVHRLASIVETGTPSELPSSLPPSPAPTLQP